MGPPIRSNWWELAAATRLLATSRTQVGFQRPMIWCDDHHFKFCRCTMRAVSPPLLHGRHVSRSLPFLISSGCVRDRQQICMFGQPNNAAALVDFYGRRQLFSESLHAELAAVPRDELDFPSNHTRRLLDRMKVCKPSHVVIFS